MMTMGSLFDGIGGFPLAAVHNGIVPVWASEIEEFPMQVTKKHFPEMLHVGDITKLDGAKLPPVDVICGGSPCQDLSVAGKRQGLSGERSGLFMDQVRIVKEMRKTDGGRRIPDHAVRPRYLVWENVPGAFSSAGGEDFRAVIEEIVRIKDCSCHVPRPDAGRWGSAGAAILGDQFSLAWRVLDAQFWGVAQRRRRIFLVADFGGLTTCQILFKQESLPGNPAKIEGAGQGAAESVEEGAGDPGGDEARVSGNNQPVLFENHGIDARYTGPHEVAPTMSARYGTGGNNVPLVTEEPESYCIAGNIIDREVKNGGNGLGCQPDISYTLTGMDRHAVYSRQRSDLFLANEVTATQSARQHKDATDLVCQPYQDMVGTLVNADHKGINNQYVDADKCVVEARNLIRRLTPLECERLQGFPDGWTDIPGVSDSARYKALGNSVAIPCVDFVLHGIAYFLRERQENQPP
ncbi:MAG: DNA cytosine methyltransferase [Lachnospiraceae bacterium]|nr:DNA cytosine methyltransferase [Lachnospiraceae bacterium]